MREQQHLTQRAGIVTRRDGVQLGA